MDAFFASVEQVDDPSLAGKPVIIGQGNRGVVSAASYEARRFGVHSAMPVVQARQLCPQGIFLKGRMGRYREVSSKIMELLCGYSPLVEQASIDEAYMDLTGCTPLFGPPKELATSLKEEILRETGLTCSVGVAPNKYLAKILSDWQKPDGLFILTPHEIPEFMVALPVEKIPGVGAAFQKELRCCNILYAGDVLLYSASWMGKRFGKRGEALYHKAAGHDDTPVVANRTIKSTSAENTFNEDTRDRRLLKRWLMDQCERVGAELRRHGLVAKTVTLKVKFSDFTVVTRSHTLHEATCSTQTLFKTASKLLTLLKLKRPVRLIGVGASKLENPQTQLSLFAPKEERESRLDTALDLLRKRHGDAIVKRGPSLEK